VKKESRCSYHEQA